MIEMILSVVLLAIIASLGVPLLAIVLAAFGFFPSLRVVLFGRQIHIGPRSHRLGATVSRQIIGARSAARGSTVIVMRFPEFATAAAVLGVLVLSSPTNPARQNSDVIVRQIPDPAA